MEPSEGQGGVTIISLTLYGYCICQFYIPSVWSFKIFFTTSFDFISNYDVCILT